MTRPEYLTVADALATILARFEPLGLEEIALSDSLGRVLGQDIRAQDSLPPFANSAMDGYALQAADIVAASSERPIILRVVGDVAAGAQPSVVLGPGEAVRIMTGAPVPLGADAIIPVEDTNEAWRESERPLPDEIAIRRAVQAGDYIRPAGQDVVAGELVLTAGHALRPADVGVLAALGVGHVPVYRRPRVGVLATGDELVGVDEPLTPGKIRNSNSYAQAAQVVAAGGLPVALGVAGDRESEVRERLQAGLSAGIDLFISSAGVSVGAYDVVKSVLAQDGRVGFWKVRMRPGKPLAFGDYQGVAFLGLPGNPVSAMLSFERFARPAIRKMGGYRAWERPLLTVTVTEDLTSDGRESYLRAIVSPGPQGYEARTTGAQGSNLMTSLVKANALLIIPEGVTEVAGGASLKAMMIDWPEAIAPLII